MNEVKRNITLNDFDCICRLCLQFNENMIDIFVSGVDSQITQVTNLKVTSDDKLPKTLCRSCNTQMNHISKFLQQAKSSDIFLRSLLTSSSESPEKIQHLKENGSNIRSQKKKFKKKTKSRIKKHPVESDNMYLIVVPKENETNSENQICIKELNNDNDNIELTQFCQTLVKNHFADHMFLKELKETSDVYHNVDDEKKIYAVNFHIYTCSKCAESFEDFENLLNHSQSHESLVDSRDYSFSCPVCVFSEKDKNKFLNHLNIHKKDGIVFEKVNINGNRMSFDETDRYLFTDEGLGCKLFRLNFLNFTCTICFSTVDSVDSIPEHLKSCLSSESEVKFFIRYTCPICHQVVVNEKDVFIDHLASHENGRIFFISVDSNERPVESGVGRVCLTHSEAVEIINIINNPEKVFKIVEAFTCHKCDYEVETYDALRRHCINMHSEEMITLDITPCPVCLKEWNTGNADENRAGLYEHLKQHKSEGIHFVRVKQNNMLASEKYPLIFTQSLILLSFLNNSLYLVDVWLPELITSHPNNQSFKVTCDLCQKQFQTKQSLIKHLKSHKELAQEKSNYICEKCGKRCVGKVNYKKHFSKHLKSSGKRPTCEICNKTFANRATLNGHVRQHLKEGRENEFKTSILGIICDKCGKSFSNSASLTKHKKLHSKDKENAVLKCEICDRDFFRQSSFDRHKSAHLNPKYLECDVCKLPLSSVVSLQKHSELHRNGSNTFDCKACKVSFLTKDSLTAHQTRAGHYLDRKPLECNVCHEKFYIGKKFTEHIKTHPKYKMGECTLCGKRLSTIQSLMVHMDRHFESNRILCPHCGKQFFEERNYHRHLLTHEGIKPFSCDVEGCVKSFYTLFELNRHKKYHNNTRDFRCSYCSKSFHEANHLTVHVRTHTGERPYTCPHCNKGFVTRTRCKHHIKLVHQGVGYDLIRSSISKKVTVYEAIEAIV